ncbi:MAG: DNA-3-methyladenine glycosylase [Candidatus Tectomicrobia bacterium]|uniref:Putative 3-methyladenine DNA glycosylase n=1 Tax=Tectimicrobiota bacterium TaxID=2528274 RepID=A0A932GN26_UNCTE|nr:DNA-3-methyladenine glycosylase [Candidatus Tectomicrobia bacterium]
MRRRGDSANWGLPLQRDFYERDTPTVARDLVGKILLHRTRAGAAGGRIVEVEAYLGSTDSASHAYRGLTPRNRPMFGTPGTVYVYFTYGMHYCMNVVTEPEGVPGAILIRALEPLFGVPLMQRRRGVKQILDLARGPARLTQALGINLTQNEADLTSEILFITDNGEKSPPLGVSGRIGIRTARELPLRFYLLGSPFVSRPER